MQLFCSFLLDFRLTEIMKLTEKSLHLYPLKTKISVYLWYKKEKSWFPHTYMDLFSCICCLLLNKMLGNSIVVMLQIGLSRIEQTNWELTMLCKAVVCWDCCSRSVAVLSNRVGWVGFKAILATEQRGEWQTGTDIDCITALYSPAYPKGTLQINVRICSLDHVK